MRSRTSRTILALFVTHFFVDAYASVFGPLAAWIHMPTEWIGPIGFLFTVATSSSQLFFGFLSDRFPGRALIAGGTFVAAICLALAGAVAERYAFLAVALLLGGLGVAAFHPSSVVRAGELGGSRRALSISLFLSTGILGYGLGPLIYVAWIERFGLSSTAWLCIPGLAASALVLAWVRDSSTRRTHLPAQGAAADRLLRDHGGVLVPLFIMVVVRSLVFISFVNFLPTLAREWGHEAAIGAVNTAFIIGTAAGSLTFGWIAPYTNRRWLQTISVLGGTPLAVAAVSSGTLPLWVIYSLLFGAGFFVGSTTSLHVAMGQEVSLRQASTISSLLMGFGWGFGALGSIAVGSLARYLSLEGALAAVAVLPFVTLPLVPRLRPRAEAPPPAGTPAIAPGEETPVGALDVQAT